MKSIFSILLCGWIIPTLIASKGPAADPHRFPSSANHGNIGCVACHHPHKAGGKSAVWETQPSPECRLPLYATSRTQVGKSSLMCLGCHDGAIADEVPVESGTMIVSQVGNSRPGLERGIGYPLGSHPIGVRYQLHSDKYVARATVAAKGFLLPENRVECISCHDPHGTTGIRHLLVKSNRRSALCLSCHQL
ncbi:MAG: cytochrome c3 family protein [Phycisphaerae bacterium]